MKSIAVYCSSSNKISKTFNDEVSKVGKLLAQKKLKIIYGGGDMGLMGELSKSATQAGGEVKGIITEHLINIERKNVSENNVRIVNTMHERKIEMYNSADSFLILPGGIGTLEEFFEVLSWKQLNLHNKPVFIYNFENFWDPLVELIEHMIKNNFAGENMKEAYKVIKNHSELEKELRIREEN